MVHRQLAAATAEPAAHLVVWVAVAAVAELAAKEAEAVATAVQEAAWAASAVPMATAAKPDMS